MQTPRQATFAALTVMLAAAAVVAVPASGQTGSQAVIVTLSEYRIQLSRSVVSQGRVDSTSETGAR